MTTTTSQEAPRFLRIGEAATLIFGGSTPSTRARVIRMTDRGDLAAIRVGERGDRLIPARELDRLLADAEANRVSS